MISREKILICTAVSFPILFLITLLKLHVNIDPFDVNYYSASTIAWLHGSIPFIDFQYSYPPLALIPLITSLNTFVFIFFMIACNTITTLCIFYISKLIYNENIAFKAGILYIFSFSATYFIITKYDALPVCLMMVAITFTLYKKRFPSYVAGSIATSLKLFPVIILPFILLYEGKRSFREWIFPVIIFTGITIISFIPFISHIDSIVKSFTRTGTIYVNTLTYLISFISIESYNEVSTGLYIACAVTLLILIYYALSVKGQTKRNLIGYTASALLIVVLCMNYRSPQYALWFTPLLCILVIDKIKYVIAYALFQIIAFVEYPLTLNILWVNNQYVSPLAIILFVIEFGLMIYLLYISIHCSIHHNTE